MSQIIRPSVENLRSLPDFTQMYRWIVHVAELPGALSGFNTQDINFRAETMTVPTMTGETSVITLRGNEIRQPGRHTYNSPFTLAMVETVDSLVTDFVSQWRNLCWEYRNGSTGITQAKADVEARMELILLNNKDEPRWKYNLIGCFLESAEMGDVDGSTSDPMRPSLSIAYDRFEDEKV